MTFNKITHSFYWAGIAIIIFASAELASRVDDWLRDGVSPLISPNFDRDLFETTEDGERRGKPLGRYKHWHLNSMGIRGPEIALQPSANRTRVLLIGSSETFGMYESPGMDFAAQLRSILASPREYDVINTALPGMTVDTARRAYSRRFARLKPHIVVIYVSPLFYLNAASPEPQISHRRDKTPPNPPAPLNAVSLIDNSRLIQRLRTAIDKPDFLQNQINARTLEAKRKALGPGCVYSAVPVEQLDLFMSDLTALVEVVEESGATAVLVTHAWRCSDELSSIDISDLESSLVNTPRATVRVLYDFETLAKKRVIALGQQRGLAVVDLAEKLNGRRAAFGDLVHFSNTGATSAAQEIANCLMSIHCKP